MSSGTTTATLRDVEVTRIPSGEKITIPAETQVVITQALGGSYTILVPSQAGLFRIEGKDADAIGQEKTPEGETGATGTLEESVWTQLKTCYDPEIPVNIVDLGLIYSMTITDGSVQVEMTLTAPGCGMGPTIANEARQKVLTIEGIVDANVDLVWEPAWSPDRISEEGRQKLGMV